MRLTSGTGSARRPGDFDDQAWGIESDDEDFVSQIAPRTNVPRSLKSTSRSSSYSSTNHHHHHHHQPQANARPQPSRSYPSSSSQQSITSASASASAAKPIPRRGSQNRRTSWTVVDRQVSGSAPNDSLDHTPIAGSPPTDLADALATGLDLDRGANASGGSGSGSGFQLVDDDQAAPANASGSETEDVDLDTGKTVRRKRQPGMTRKPSSGTTEAETLRQSLRTDLDHLVRDPAHVLTRLAAQWSASSHRPSPGTDQGPAQPLATTSRLGVAPTPTAQEFTFDPIAAAGDGLIITGPSFVDATAANRAMSTSSSSASYLTSTDASSSHDTDLTTDADAGGSSSSNGAGSKTGMSRKRSVRTSRRRQQLLGCLSKQSVDIAQLRTLAWAGVPDELRPVVWQLLLGYLPAVASVRASTLSRKRAEYAAGVELAFAKGIAALDQAIWHQIHIDVPRTNPGIRLWQRQATQRSLERILYVWAIRHPASGYVQGINDLATPFFEVFLSAYIESDPEMFDVALLPANVLEAIEADTFWCLSKLLDGIQDNYIFAQPGIQRQVRRLGELVARIDGEYQSHIA